MVRFSSPKGTQDILPEDQRYWEHLLNVVASTAASYGFERIDTPVFESTELFARGVGSGTDIVEKEMSLDLSNVGLFNPETGAADRVGIKFLEDGRKVRVFKSNGEVVDV